MQHSDLIQLVRLLSKPEIRQAELFIRSPYFNTSETVLKLFQYVRRYHPELSSYKLKKEHAYAHLFPQEEFKDKRLRAQMSKLKKLLERFVIDQRLQKDEAIQQRLLIEYYNHEGDYEQFSRLVEGAPCLPRKNKKNVMLHTSRKLFGCTKNCTIIQRKISTYQVKIRFCN